MLLDCCGKFLEYHWHWPQTLAPWCRRLWEDWASFFKLQPYVTNPVLPRSSLLFLICLTLWNPRSEFLKHTTPPFILSFLQEFDFQFHPRTHVWATDQSPTSDQKERQENSHYSLRSVRCSPMGHAMAEAVTNCRVHFSGHKLHNAEGYTVTEWAFLSTGSLNPVFNNY